MKKGIDSIGVVATIILVLVIVLILILIFNRQVGRGSDTFQNISEDAGDRAKRCLQNPMDPDCQFLSQQQDDQPNNQQTNDSG